MEENKKPGRKAVVATPTVSETERVNPLKNEKVFVRFVPKAGSISDPHHPMSGAKADGTTTRLCCPVLRSGQKKNVLTDAEKDFLEEAMQLDYNALSVYKPEDNFWDSFYVELNKDGIYLDLSSPVDYIKYKILLACKDIVAPSVQDRLDHPKNTYQYEIVRESEDIDMATAKMDATMSSYKEYGKIESDIDTLRVLIELLDGRPYSPNEKLEFLKSRVQILINSDPKAFLRQITDPLLHTKMLIRRGVELGKLSKRGDYYYLKADGSPLCDNGEDPTLTIAARYLNQPSHQEIKFILESAVEENRK